LTGEIPKPDKQYVGTRGEAKCKKVVDEDAITQSDKSLNAIKKMYDHIFGEVTYSYREFK
jgi:hypothetical protein